MSIFHNVCNISQLANTIQLELQTGKPLAILIFQPFFTFDQKRTKAMQVVQSKPRNIDGMTDRLNTVYFLKLRFAGGGGGA